MPTLDIDGVSFDLSFEEAIAHAKQFLPDGVGIDMCRHPSVIEACFWLFRDGKQIGSASEDGRDMWRATKMNGGLPTAQRRFDSLKAALQFAAG